MPDISYIIENFNEERFIAQGEQDPGANPFNRYIVYIGPLIIYIVALFVFAEKVFKRDFGIFI